MATQFRYRQSRYNVWVDRGNFHYVYNGISGAVLAVPTKQYIALQRSLNSPGDTTAECPPSLLKDLLFGQMLVEQSCDELATLAARYQAGHRATDHFGLTIIPSLGCNFDCPYCFEDKHWSIMDADCQRAVVRMLDDKLSSIKSFSVTWFGGEPLVGKSAVLELSDMFIDRCDRAQVSYSADIVTNGSLLDDATCVQLRERRIVSTQVTLDGPPHIHDRMRPMVGGRGTFWKIIANLHTAIKYLNVSIRVNVDHHNLEYAEALLKILKEEGFSGKLTVGLGQLVGIADGAPAPSSTYRHACLSNRDFAVAQQKFMLLAEEYGFGGRPLPVPVGTPCTAVRINEVVIGSHGELYKCYLSVGNPAEVIGNIRQYNEPNGRIEKWLKYDPFKNEECRSCIALPVCMGGCAHHAMDLNLYENRCGTFRHTYLEQVGRFVEMAEEGKNSVATPVTR